MKTIHILVWALCILISTTISAQVTQQVTAIQYYFNTDPGVGEVGNGAIIPVTPSSSLNQTFSLALPGSLNPGFHNLYVRTKDEFNRWSIAERRMFYISNTVNSIPNIVAYQYYFNSDLGVGIPGNGAIVPISSTTDYNSTISISLPVSLNQGFHNLYIRVKDDQGVWSIAERRMFYISTAVNSNPNMVAYQYYFDSDPGVGIPGNGAIIPISATTDYNSTVAIIIPPTLNNGLHNLYIRMKDENGVWSIIERRMLYITDNLLPQNIIALEYYYDNDPGIGNANPYPVSSTTEYNNNIMLGVPCLSTGTHYLYIRAKNNFGRWSIIERGTIEITEGLAASDVTPAGPLTICTGGNIVLSTTSDQGVTYQWVESGNPIIGETNASLTVTAAGNYALRSICGTSFTVSNLVSVTVQALNTYYADADNDGYGNSASTVQDCIQPAGYVINDDDCNDEDMNINPAGIEICGNDIDENCDGILLNTHGTALNFDGNNDYVSLGNWFNYPEFTIQFWAKPGSTQQQYADIIDNNHSSTNWVIQQNNTNTNQYEFGAGGVGTLFNLIANQWQHVTIVKSASHSKVYIDGAFVVSNPSGPTNYGNPPSLNIGRWNGGSRHWNGSLDEIRFWNKPLHAADIFSNYNCQFTYNPSCLVARYTMNEGFIDCNNTGLTTLTDATGNHNGTLNNFALNGVTSNYTEGIVTSDCSFTEDSDGDCYSSAVDCDDNNPNINPGEIEICGNDIDENCDGIIPNTPGTALDFDGINDQVSLGTGYFNYQQFTIQMWINPAATQVTYADIIDNNHVSNINWVVQQNESIYNSYNFGSCSFNLSPNQWQHLSLVKTPTQIKIYINGSLVNYLDHGDFNYSNPTHVLLGNWNGGGRNWKGKMDDVRFWSYALSETEIASYNSCEIDYSCGSPTGLISNYKMNQGFATCNNTSISQLNDETGMHHGVLQNFWLNGSTSNFVIGQSSPNCPCCADSDNDGFTTCNNDCNDNNPNVNSNAVEICNGIDDDCDGQIDEGVQLTFYADADNDGYGTSMSSVQACTQPIGYATNSDDCNDNNINVNPNATEICNGMDDDCDGLMDDNDPTVTGQSIWYLDADYDGYGISTSSLQACNQPPGYVANDDDCNDGNINVHPNAIETCNGVDDNCNGLEDDDDPGVIGQLTWYRDFDNDSYGDAGNILFKCIQPSGYVANANDCDDMNPNINPANFESCNELDDNCDGQIDENVKLTFYADTDNDGFGNPSVTILACILPTGYAYDNTDCNDNIFNVHPGAMETCNGIDDNCDGYIDEGFTQSIPIEAIFSSSGNQFCLGQSTTLSIYGGSLGSGANWYWYENDCEVGTDLGNGPSINITPSAGTHTYYVRAEGTCNVSACVSISITVYTAPSFTSCPIDISISNDATICGAIKTYSISLSGNPAPVVTYTFSGATTDSGSGTGSGSIFNIGTTTITITANNLCGTTVCAFNITVIDTEVATITACPSTMNAVVEPGQWGAHVTWIEPTASDNCELSSLTSNHSSGDFFIVGTTNVTYTAEDISANNSACSFDVIVTPPVILGDVNISIFANDIQFSNLNPTPGSFITISATVHNNSNVDAAAFVCHLLNQYSGATYPDFIVPALGANQSTVINWNIQTPPVPAFVPMQISIDHLNKINESNELDNQAIRPFINGDFVTGGRIILIANAIPSTAIAGSGISICGSAHYTQTAVQLIDSSVAGAQLTITIVETGQVLNGVTNSNGDFCIPYFTPNTPGLYHFEAEVTDFTLTGDTTGLFQLTPSINQCPTDLSISMEVFGTFLCDLKHHIAQGSSLTGVVHVTNSCAIVNMPTTLFIALPDGSPVPGPFTIPPLTPGQTYDVALPSMIFNSVGTTYISATVDYYNELEEDNEINNTRSITINVHPILPDIIPVDCNVSTNYQCIPSIVSFKIENQGGVPTGSFNAVLEVYQGTTLENTLTQIANSIPGLCQSIISFNVNPLFTGPYNFILKCDNGNDIIELSEINNNYSKPHYYESCNRDLIVYGGCAIDVKPTDPVTPEMINIYATIANEGLLAVTNPFSVNFDVAGTNYPISVNVPILPNGTKDISVSVPTPTHGNNDLMITVDSNHDVVESEEGNNSTGENLCWDFKVSNKQCDGEPVMDGAHFLCNPLYLETRVFNLGLYEASNLQIHFEVSGPGLPLGWTSLGVATTFIDFTCTCPLAVGLPGSFLFPQTGTFQLRITADFDNLYTECNETNNQIILNIDVVESADYAVYSQYIAPSELNPDLNEAITLNLSYKNEGCSGSNPNELYVQVDNSPLDSLIAIPLTSSGIHTYAISQSWSSGLPGLHVIREVIDHDNVIAEIDELNNEATRSIIVGRAPNFHITDLTSSNPTPSTGETITLTATVTNEGDNNADGILQILRKNEQNEEILIEQHSLSLNNQETIIQTTNWFVTQPQSEIIARVSNVDPVEYDFTDNEQQLQLNNLSVNILKTEVACSGIDLGILETIITGGQAPYAIQWSTGYTDEIIYAPAGMYSVEVTDVNGLTANALATIINLSSPNTWYQDVDGDNFGNPDIYEFTCIQPSGYVGTGTDCNDNDATIYPGAPEILDGKDNDCDGLIDEGLSTLSIEAGDCNIVFLGYAPSECTNLSVNAQGGTTPYSYLWSNGATTATTIVCPQVTTIYNVTVTDYNGFTAQDAVTVQVVDLKCGNKKVNICHIPPGNPANMHTICVSVNAIPAHLAHGCYLGICDAQDPCEDLELFQYRPHIIADPFEKIEIFNEHLQNHISDCKILYPNPTNQFVKVELGNDEETYQLYFYSVSGRLIKSVENVKNKQTISTTDLDNGIYYVSIKSSTANFIEYLIVIH